MHASHTCQPPPHLKFALLFLRLNWWNKEAAKWDRSRPPAVDTGGGAISICAHSNQRHPPVWSSSVRPEAGKNHNTGAIPKGGEINLCSPCSVDLVNRMASHQKPAWCVGLPGQASGAHQYLHRGSRLLLSSRSLASSYQSLDCTCASSTLTGRTFFSLQ